MPPEIRLAREEDLEGIAYLLRVAFMEAQSRYTPEAYAATTPGLPDLIARMVAGPIWVAEECGELVGTIAAESRSSDMHIRSLAVHPAARGRRLGGVLLDTVERHAQDQGFVRITLLTTTFLHAAIGLYHSAGYYETGERVNLHGTPLLAMAKSFARIHL